jgi:FMN phosphatase YigB (HAD superfamily)
LFSAILFDIDGVLIKHKDYFSGYLEKHGYLNASKILDEFYTGSTNKECDRGTLDPFIEIEPYIKRINWAKSTKEFFDEQYNYEEQYIDYEILDYIRGINQNNVPCYIASNQNSYRKIFLVEKMKIDEVFNNAFFSSDFGYVKPEMNYWDYMYKSLLMKNKNIKVQDIVFFDDICENVESAKKYGFISYQIENTTNIKELINSILKN